MISCGHEKRPFGVPLCEHIRECRQPWLRYVKWYVGRSLDFEFICVPCAEACEKGQSISTDRVCQECFEYATTEVCDLVKTCGKPEIRVSPAPFNTTLERTAIPKEIGRIVDFQPLNEEGRSSWLLLADNKTLFKLQAESGICTRVGTINVRTETVADPFAGHGVTPHLHVSDNGRFVAVVNDYGRHGKVTDLASGKATLKVDGGDYHPETVPLSFAFAEWRGRTIAIYRTAWNRLDVSDAATGELLTSRGPTTYQTGEQRPKHYLDHFHGGLYVSPESTQILDDGWVWHPVGIPTVWNIDQWLSDNVWESEDGPTRRDICAREYYWDHGIAWLDERRVAIAGIGHSDIEMIDGARIFDVTCKANAVGPWRSDWLWAKEVVTFPGPTGRFFSDGQWLYSSSEAGFFRWDPETGARTGHLGNFRPTHHHRSAKEFVELRGSSLIRWPY